MLGGAHNASYVSTNMDDLYPFTVKITKAMRDKLTEEAAQATTAARPHVTLSEVARELLNRPLRPESRARRSAATKPTGGAS